MPHKYLPRLWAGVLTAAAGVACRDPAPPPAPRLLLAVETPPGDTAAQVAVGVAATRSDSAALRELRVYVDSAVRPLPVTTDAARFTTPVLGAVAYLGGPGRHTVTVAVTDTAGRVLSASFVRTVTLDSAVYAATALPDAGAGATPEFIHPTGVVAGAVTSPEGRERPAVWRGGQLQLVPVGDSLEGTARRLNAAGDVLLQLRPRGPADTAFQPVRVLRADGALFALGPWRWTPPPFGTNTYPTQRLCCAVAADLNDARQAVAANVPIEQFYLGGGGSVTFDVAAGQQADTVRATLGFANAAGQLLGTQATGGLYNSVYLVTRGFTPGRLPAESSASVCDWVGRYSTLVPLGLDEGGTVVARWCGNPVFLSPGGSVWLDRYLGPRLTTLRLSARGGLVAALDSAAGALYVWRADTRRAVRVVAGGGWRVVRLAGVTPEGAVAVRAVAGATGRAAALVLTPAGR